VSAQFFDKIVYEGREYGLAVLPLETYFTARPELRPRFSDFNSACMRGYVARWEVRGDRLFLAGMEMIRRTDATFASLFPGMETEGVFAGWVSGKLTCPYGNLVKYDHAGFARTLEHELILSVENGLVRSAKVKDNVKEDKR
jgi:hypothetical protein